MRERLRALVAGDPGPEPADPTGAVTAEVVVGGGPVTVVRSATLRPVVVVVVAASLAAWLALRFVSGPAPAPVELVAGTPVPTSSASGLGLPGVVATAAATPAVLVVHVVGEVRRPGLVRLASGARVADAMAAAGGLVPGGSSGELNLARPVVDGEQILVTPEAVSAPAAGAGSADGVVDLNTANERDLDALPGVGPVLAARILEWRSAHGRFASVEQLREVSGIGARTFEQLKARVRV